MSADVERFVDQLVQSGLMSQRDVAEFRRTLAGGNKNSVSAEDLAKELVRARRLTKFQASAIYQGKTQGLIFGDYLVLDKIGTGGMGKVFKAKHRQSERIVALKVMSTQAMKSPKAVRRFKQEANAAKRLNHPHIVATYDAGEVDSMHFLIMQFVDGDNLRSQVKSRGPLPIPEVIDYTIQVAEGLEYAHNVGVIHRDIKPSNLLLDKTGQVWILDMGLARIEENEESEDGPRLTVQGQMLGTAEYMSPEQVEDPRFANAASDVYSLGCTMYYLLTGTPPYRGNSVPETLILHAQSPIPRLKSRRPDASDDLENIFRRMLSKNPAERFGTAAEVLVALKRLRDGEAQHLPPVPVNVSQDTEVSAVSNERFSRDFLNQSLMSMETGMPKKEMSLPFAGDQSTVRPHEQTLDLMRRQNWLIGLVVGLLVAVLMLGGMLMFVVYNNMSQGSDGGGAGGSGKAVKQPNEDAKEPADEAAN